MRDRELWLRWVLANAAAEFVGLGLVAVVGFVLASRFGEPSTVVAAITFAAAFVSLGAVEGFVVGWFQGRVLKRVLPQARGWVGATVLGAMAAWTIGMVPSTVMSLMAQQEAASAPDLGPTTQVLLAVALGLVAGPVLAFFQWRCLRQLLANAWYWLPANALAWAVGMPIVFQAVELASGQADVAIVVAIVSIALFLAGAVVGAIHGAFLVWLRR